ncbi:DNA mismatch repair protein mutL [Lineolata rhizophorae]|uniref:DNA mismatch repair protein mutL n=1 Tax=Lineolata rhizophorae TaxID=578093 RepID=A0A6A6P5T4_9PEZI|nr:DNA mismatch repair protein mutL [Lineolata rhizophorae]
MKEGLSNEQGLSRGTKRKPDEDEILVQPPRRIRALAQDVVNKIAAGEIIVAPVHALKELIENSVDAGATMLEILVKEGGLKLLQITDNGHGINRDDLPVLCERFTTSKLKAFEDLTSIGTYGFRGEALASISHIAHLTVATRTKDSSCAWRASYADGKMAAPKAGQSAEPKACAGRIGTQITVEDLFYNIPNRRRAFRSASEEYAKILDLVGRYAIHCTNVAFSCKKHGDSTPGISVPEKANTLDRIRHVHGSSVANELIPLEISDDRWGFKAELWASNANYSVKKTTFLLFINHRAVESSAIKKAVDSLYSTFLPKGGHPFVYLSLEIEPQRVDVNVHPTKREVNFLNEEEIIGVITNEIRENLGKVDTSRTFMTQTLLPGAQVLRASVETPRREKLPTDAEPDPQLSKSIDRRPPASKQRPYENNLIRTDSRARKITSMLSTGQQSMSAQAATGGDTGLQELKYKYSDKEPTVCRLTSIKELRAEVRDNMHNELTDVFASHTFVGVVDERKRIAAIQSGVKLYLVDYGMICNEYFYQLGLTDFGNFGCIRFEPPLSLQEILNVAATQERTVAEAPEDFDWDEVVIVVRKQLINRRDMLAEYFSVEISEDGDLHAIPLMMKGYLPSMAKLPQFLLRLGPHVNWLEEKACFQSFLRELASFYVPESLPTPPPPASQTPGMEGDEGTVDKDSEDAEVHGRRLQLNRAIENVVFPAFKARLVSTRGLLKGVVEVANLKGLYRVFERC